MDIIQAACDLSKPSVLVIFVFLIASGTVWSENEKRAETRHRNYHEASVKMNKVNLAEKFALINEHWRPKVVGELNGQDVKLVKFQGEFPWHQHEHEDEMFLAMKGSFRIEFRDKTVDLSEGEFVIVPRGVEHRPVADEEVEVLLFEPANVKNTGNIEDQKFTAPSGEKI